MDSGNFREKSSYCENVSDSSDYMPHLCKKRSPVLNTLAPAMTKQEGKMLTNSEVKLESKKSRDSKTPKESPSQQSQPKRFPASEGSSRGSVRSKGGERRPDSPLIQHWVLNDFHFEDLLKDGSEPESHPMLDIPQDINHMLGVVVSTVMMLAHGHPKCPNDNLSCASLFLRNIKDDRGDLPHNIESILNIIQVMKSNKEMKKTERIKRKPVIKGKDISSKRLTSISSLKTRNSGSSIGTKELLEENAAIVKEKFKERIPDVTEKETEENKILSVIQEPTPIVVTQSFIPQLYHFRLPGASSLVLDSSSAETPPYWLLLDHTLGVIWTLFSPQQQKSGLGVSELHWALEFLKGIRSPRGENPKDVKICINAIEDKLIELYAKISNKSDGLNQKSSMATNSSTSNSSLVHSDCQRNTSGSGSSIGRYVENMRKRSVLSTAVTKSPQPYPLSVTYEEILNRSPRSVQQLYRAEPKGFHASEGIIIEENLDLEQSKSNVSVPYNKLVEFLTDWRREQVDRIQTELKRLHSIEQFMGTLEKDDFQPYVDGRLPQKLYELKASIAADLSSNAALIPASFSTKPKPPERS